MKADKVIPLNESHPRAEMLITLSLLTELFNLPEGHKVVDVKCSSDGMFVMVIEGPDMPWPDHGGRLKQISPVFESVYQQATRFVSWR